MNWILTIASFVTAITVILTALKKILNAILDNFFQEKIDPLFKSINKLDEHHCKDYLVNFLNKVKNGEIISEIDRKRAYEVYDHYTNDLHKNSYIHDEWEKYMN